MGVLRSFAEATQSKNTTEAVEAVPKSRFFPVQQQEQILTEFSNLFTERKKNAQFLTEAERIAAAKQILIQKILRPDVIKKLTEIFIPLPSSNNNTEGIEECAVADLLRDCQWISTGCGAFFIKDLEDIGEILTDTRQSIIEGRKNIRDGSILISTRKPFGK